METGIKIETLYNKYRPRTFDSIVGQNTPVKTLRNAVMSGKVANAYLFSGPRGTGKTSTARIFAKALLCNGRENKGTVDGCGECECCTAMNNGAFIDFCEIDAASNRGIDNIRTLISQIQLSPSISKRKVILIDEVHHLTSEAATALLKVIEEPPNDTVFLLATTNPMKLQDTIRSRCQWLRFKPLSNMQIINRIDTILRTENIGTEEGVSALIARQCHGGMRDALSMLDLLITFCNGKTISLADAESCFGTISQSALSDMCDNILANDCVNILSVPQILAEGDGTGSPQDMVLAFADIISSAILCSYDSSLVGVDTGYGADFSVSVSEFAKQWSISRLIYTRDVIEKNYWKFENTSFNSNDVFVEIMVQVMNPHTASDIELRIDSMAQTINEIDTKNDKELASMKALIDLIKKMISSDVSHG